MLLSARKIIEGERISTPLAKSGGLLGEGNGGNKSGQTAGLELGQRSRMARYNLRRPLGNDRNSGLSFSSWSGYDDDLGSINLSADDMAILNEILQERERERKGVLNIPNVPFKIDTTHTERAREAQIHLWHEQFEQERSEVEVEDRRDEYDERMRRVYQEAMLRVPSSPRK